MNPQSVSLITLGVDDLDGARVFYAALGWEAAQAKEALVIYRLDAMALGLFRRAALAADQARLGAALGTGAIALAQTFPDRTGVDAAFTRVEPAGATVLKRLGEVFWGGCSGYIADPISHVWEYAHNPFWTLDVEGRLHRPDPT